MFSRACEYVIKAMIFVESGNTMERQISLAEIAEAIDSSVAYASKILQQLQAHA